MLRLPWGAGERPTGDAALMYSLASTMVRFGWFTYNPDLGFPLGMDAAHIPFAESHQWATLWVISRGVRDPIVALNLFFLLGYAAVGACGFLLFRATSGAGGLSVVLGVAGATLPWHLHRFQHTLLADYSPVPVFLLLAYLMWTGWWLGTRRRLWLAVIAGCYIGTSGAYFAAFGLLVLVPVQVTVAWRRRALRATLIDVLVVGMIPISLALSAILQAALIRTGSEGPGLRGRTAEMSLVFAGDPSTLMVPWPLQHSRLEGSALVSPFVAIGVVATFGLVFGLAVNARGRMRGRGLEAAVLPWLRLLTWSLVWFLPGLGWVFATLATPQIRSWGRMSVVVVYISLVICGLMWVHVRPQSWRMTSLLRVSAVVILVSGIVIDHRALLVARDAAGFDADLRSFASQAASVVPSRCPVLVLPPQRFPEGPWFGSNTGPYDQLWVPLYDADHRYSAGVMEGTAGARREIARYAAAREPGSLASIVAHAHEDGFCAVQTDDDIGGELARALVPLLGPPDVRVGRWSLSLLGTPPVIGPPDVDGL